MRAFGSLVALGLAVAAVALTPSTAAAKRSCAQAKSKTAVRTAEVRVFSVIDEDGWTQVYGCLTASGRKRVLAAFEGEGTGVNTDYSGVTDARIAGRYVAWHLFHFQGGCKADCPINYDYTKDELHVYDLQRGRTTRRTPVPDYTAGSLAVTQRGAIAWLTPASSGQQQLIVSDRDGVRTLDTGAIAPASVGAEISIVSWTRDGTERYARLR